MNIGIRESFKRTFKLLRKNLISTGILIVIMFVSMTAMSIGQIALMAPGYILFLLLGGALAGGAALIGDGGYMLIPGIILIMIGCLIGLAIVVLFTSVIIMVGSAGFALNIFVADILTRMKLEGKVPWKRIREETTSDWKGLLRKGAGLFLRFMVILLPAILIIDLFYGGLLVLFIWGFSKGNNSGTTVMLAMIGMILVSILFTLVLMLIIPILQFIMDDASIRIAEGKDVRSALKLSISDVRKSRRGLTYYVVGVSLFMLASIILFPVAFILQSLYPVLTKAFIAANRDLFCD